jgi:hypothetical protein
MTTARYRQARPGVGEQAIIRQQAAGVADEQALGDVGQARLAHGRGKEVVIGALVVARSATVHNGAAHDPGRGWRVAVASMRASQSVWGKASSSTKAT